MVTRNQETNRPYPAEKARQGRIVLSTPVRRLIFFTGLAALVLLVLVSIFLPAA